MWSSHLLLAWQLAGLIALSSFLDSVSAGGIAGCFERVGPLYQTYRIAVDTWGADQKKFLPGLAATTGGAHPDGGHNFLQVMNYLDGANKYSEADLTFDDEKIDINKATPVYTAAQMLYYKNAPDLVPLPLLFRNAPETWPDALGQIKTIHVEGKSTHREMKDQGKLDKIYEHRLRLEVCHEEALLFRQSDSMDFVPKDIKKVTGWENAVPITVKEPWHINDEFEITKFNAEETVEKSPDGMFTDDSVKNWVAEYGNRDSDTKAAKNHHKVIAQLTENKASEYRLLYEQLCG
ncbi:hypothetical protein Micbo1qcDRAFT_178869 [Microdochium bolleyi]|uniref:Uncharacterized protein n=1 Tax=Microdochium bolleyi TaxID=196109 RepID=A0A136ISL2_9PEZI|nr:hypothetical protein Micbo1qcDRAFT_178869 [Microdochium bolleyi]